MHSLRDQTKQSTKQPPLNERDRARRLNEAVEKIVCFGESVGVSPKEMNEMLDAGMTIWELLAFLISKDGSAVA